jgi:hypothetical protein
MTAVCIIRLRQLGKHSPMPPNVYIGPMTTTFVWHSVRWLWNDNIDHQRRSIDNCKVGGSKKLYMMTAVCIIRLIQLGQHSPMPPNVYIGPMTTRLVRHSVRWLWNNNIDHQKEKYWQLQSGWVKEAVHDDGTGPILLVLDVPIPLPMSMMQEFCLTIPSAFIVQQSLSSKFRLISA